MESRFFSSPLLQEYADANHVKGIPLENCFGFIDGTVRPIARPNQQQRIVYNDGHERVHSLELQSVALPNGLIGKMYGPFGKLLMYIVKSHNRTERESPSHAFGIPLFQKSYF